MTLRDHPFFRELVSLDLPSEDYVVAGSAPLLAHGIQREIGDLDVVARGAAWEIASKQGIVSKAPLGYAQMVVLFGGDIEVLDGWFDYSVSALIDEAELFEGVRFMPLARVIEWKLRLDREADVDDIVLIKKHLDGAKSDT